MARPLSPARIRRLAITKLQAAIDLALEHGDHEKAGAFAINLARLASQLAKAQSESASNGSGAIAPRVGQPSPSTSSGLIVGRRPD
jgi:hypothetical protein